MINLGNCPFCQQRLQEREKMMKGQEFDISLLKKAKCPICGRSWVEIDDERGGHKG